MPLNKIMHDGINWLIASNLSKMTSPKLNEKPGLVVKAEDSRPRGRGFKSPRILDGCKRFAIYYIKIKIENKGSQVGHTKKNIFKKLLLHT